MTLTLQDSLELEEIFVEGYEKVVKVKDDKAGLLAIISIHDSSLGPTLGGTRIFPYVSFEDALTDVLRLSKGMTYKSAASECALGGAKSVIMLDPKKGKTEEMLISFGRAVESLNGLYTCAEDVGCSVQDVSIISRATKYVTGLDHEKSSGNPSYFTAWGVYRGIQAALKKVFGDESVKDKKVAIQGVGSVGRILADLLFWHGANLVITDVDASRAQKVARQYGASYCAADEIWSEECDVFSPCALGGILNLQTIPKLKCRIVAGAANNQLLTENDADELKSRGILYAPDYVINAGGLINVAEEITIEGYKPESARRKTDKLFDQLLTIFDIAEQNGCSTSQAANSLVEYRLKYKIGKRQQPPYYHHAQS
ncbi:MAG: Glu/Leu/Phe/Val dehydrogenase [Chlamydiae bacterium]|nr:Glu/Leu/Phe/Val dehydrogenase [Chlamydiota bacterium]